MSDDKKDDAADNDNTPWNPPCDEAVLVLMRKLKRACRVMVRYHDEHDCKGECQLCHMSPFTIMHLCDLFISEWEGHLYRTPIVCGEEEPADEPVVRNLPDEPSAN